MTGSLLELPTGNVWVEHIGTGQPVVYLHGIVDIHGTEPGPLPFHTTLAQHFELIAPAHPGCAKTDEDEHLVTIDDVVFHYLRVFDALALDQFSLVGSSLGGWIAAEIAVRYPERIKKLTLISPTGLAVPGHQIADIFWYAQPDDGERYDQLRNLLFAEPGSEFGKKLIPDAKDTIEREMGKYRVFRFASLIGFKPPYLYNPRLRSRLDRYRKPALVLSGQPDSLVPRAHVDAYSAGFSDGRLEVLENCGHSLYAEAPEAAAEIVHRFIAS